MSRDTNGVSDLFPGDPERDARSRRMNSMILAAARRGTPTGGAVRLAGEPASNPYPRERLSSALNDLERARSEAQAAREAAEPEQPPVSFDGGFMGRRSVAPPAGMVEPESATQLLRRSFETRASEIRERSPAARQVANFNI